MSSLETCLVSCSENNKVSEAEVLKRSEKSIRVVLKGTNITMNMTRQDTRRPYVGTLHKLEFTTMG